jgi:hypothetical protein
VVTDLEPKLRSVWIADVDGLAVVNVDYRHPTPIYVGPIQRAVVDGEPAPLVETQQ